MCVHCDRGSVVIRYSDPMRGFLGMRLYKDYKEAIRQLERERMFPEPVSISDKTHYRVNFSAVKNKLDTAWFCIPAPIASELKKEGWFL